MEICVNRAECNQENKRNAGVCQSSATVAFPVEILN